MNDITAEITFSDPVDLDAVSSWMNIFFGSRFSGMVYSYLIDDGRSLNVVALSRKNRRFAVKGIDGVFETWNLGWGQQQDSGALYVNLHAWKGREVARDSVLESVSNGLGIAGIGESMTISVMADLLERFTQVSCPDMAGRLCVMGTKKSLVASVSGSNPDGPVKPKFGQDIYYSWE